MTLAPSTLVSFQSSLWYLIVNRLWSMPSARRTVAFRSLMYTGFSTDLPPEYESRGVKKLSLVSKLKKASCSRLARLKSQPTSRVNQCRYSWHYHFYLNWQNSSRMLALLLAVYFLRHPDDRLDFLDHRAADELRFATVALDGGVPCQLDQSPAARSDRVSADREPGT
jgi:hypothetical protein